MNQPRPTREQRITIADRIIGFFVPLGYNYRTERVVIFKAELKRRPMRYLVRNLSAALLIATYSSVIHPGGVMWAIVHGLLNLPFLATALAAAEEIWDSDKW